MDASQPTLPSIRLRQAIGNPVQIADSDDEESLEALAAEAETCYWTNINADRSPDYPLSGSRVRSSTPADWSSANTQSSSMLCTATNMQSSPKEPHSNVTAHNKMVGPNLQIRWTSLRAVRMATASLESPLYTPRS